MSSKLSSPYDSPCHSLPYVGDRDYIVQWNNVLMTAEVTQHLDLPLSVRRPYIVLQEHVLHPQCLETGYRFSWLRHAAWLPAESTAAHTAHHIVCWADDSIGAASNHLKVLVARVNLKDLFSHPKRIKPSLPQENVAKYYLGIKPSIIRKERFLGARNLFCSLQGNDRPRLCKDSVGFDCFPSKHIIVQYKSSWSPADSRSSQTRRI